MQTLPQLGGRRSLRRDPGMVLVIILAMIVLVTIAIMAFFTHATANQQTETSRSNRTEADLLAQSAGDYVASLFVSEIVNSANSSNTAQNNVTIYFPKSPTNLMPRRALSTGVSLSDTNFFNLVRQSTPNNGADINASSHGTAVSSRNGRTIAPARWNYPVLLGSAGFTATNQLPNWIYVTRNGGITATPDTNVIGRFAYNIYDISGLLNANVSGFPGNISATNILQLKTSVAGADLTLLPGLSGNSTAVEQLVNFRNRGTIDSENFYLAGVRVFLADGYTNAIASNSLGRSTNNFFTGRQDLIRYARTQNKVFTNALPYLTHFSRSLTAPSWRPVSPPSSTINYEQERESAAGVNRSFLTVRVPSDVTIVHYSDEGVGEEINLKEGEPLMQKKFSLAKLAWLTPAGPKAGISTAAIESCFGLRWDIGKERWDYVAYSTTADPSGNSSPHIKTLGELVDNPPFREPNFFELLKAGILRGSVGVVQAQETMVSDNTSMSDQNDRVLMGNRDLQILRIGANIIDCADADNYPTILGMNISTSVLPQIIEIPGVEDLPYLNYLSMCGFRKSVPDTTVTGRNYRMTECDIVWVPELFNPHAPSSFTSGPSSIQFNVLSGVLTYVGCNVGSPNGFPTVSPNKPLVGAASADILNADFEQFRAGPTAIHQNYSPFRMEKVIPYFTGTKKDVVAVPIYSYQTEYPDFSASWVTSGYGINRNPGPWGWRFNYNSSSSSGSHFISVQNTVVGLSYRSPSNTQWKTYSTFGGFMVDDTDGVVRPYTGTGLEGLWNGFSWSSSKYLFAFFPMIPSGTTYTDFATNVMFAAAWDPRTSRLGIGFGQGGRRPLENPTTVSGTVGQINLGLPFSSSAMNPGARPQAGTTSANAWPDADGVYRPADAYLSSTANLFTNPSNYALRPQLLQRPYRTVGELGYVFRDLPWKSLSFFDSSSPDAALLDIFCVSEEPKIVADKVSLNARQPAVLAALLSQTPENISATSVMSSSLSTNVASALSTKYSFSSGTVTTNAMLSPANLASFMSSSELTNSAVSLSPVKNIREAAIRAWGESTQTRTWNLFADVIVQVGRFPSQSATTAAGDFVVDAERRIWLSEAVDRFTGEVIDRSYETVGE